MNDPRVTEIPHVRVFPVTETSTGPYAETAMRVWTVAVCWLFDHRWVTLVAHADGFAHRYCVDCNVVECDVMECPRCKG